jgi:endonuclease/exonuclease/phosphatase family metal-dependent hydrolase
MFPLPRVLLFLLFISVLTTRGWGFTIVAYNVENLFDMDGLASYEDYAPDKYSPRHLLVKVQNIATVLSKIDAGRGPDVVILNEIELDQSPNSPLADPNVWLDSVKNRTLEEILLESPLPTDAVSQPAEMWLLKALEQAGLGRYHLAIPDETPSSHEDGRPRSVKNAILSRFPITNVKTLPTLNARAILEATLDVNGHPLTVFANHWKSGAGSIDQERIRMANARTLRDRLDEIFKKDSQADVIIGGDLNSHYNQTLRYPAFKKSAINEVLGSQGNELALESGEADLYNLWFELPADQRGSDVYQNEWGTLMHLIASKGLYDTKGVQYKDNTFEVLAIPGLNADALGRPLRWSRGSNPSGFSDHFPILAKFQITEAKSPKKWMPLSKPSLGESDLVAPAREVSAKEIFANAINPANEPLKTDFRKPEWLGKVFLIEAPAQIGKRGIVSVDLNGITYNLFSPEKDARDRLRELAKNHSKIRFHAQLNTFKGEWQFFLPKADWILKSD